MPKPTQSLTGLEATSGHKILSFGLVQIEVCLMPAFDTTANSRPTRNKLCADHPQTQVKQKWWCPEGKHEVEKDKVVNGVSMGGTKTKPTDFVLIPDDEWKKLEAVTTPTIQLKAWLSVIDSLYFEQPYYIFPSMAATAPPFALLLHLLKDKGGYLVGTTEGDHGTAKLFAIGYSDTLGCLMATVCRHASQLRTAPSVKIGNALASVPVTAEGIELATQILSTLPTEFDPREVQDSLGVAQWALVKALQVGKTLKEQGVRAIDAPLDLMEALKASVKKSPPVKKKERRKVAA